MYPQLQTYGSSRPTVFCKKGVLKNFAKVTGKNLRQGLFLNKVTLAQVLSCEFYKTFKSTVFYRTPPVFASEPILIRF